MVDIDYDDVARAAVGMAKYVDKIRPDAILLPLRSGWTTSKLVMEALRSNLGVSAFDYDPPMFPVALNFINKPYIVAKDQLARLEKLREQKEVKEMYPQFEKIMIIDFTNWGISPSHYLSQTLDEITRFGERIYVNFMASSDREIQERALRDEDLLEDKRFEFHFSRIKNAEIPFDDDSWLIGIKHDKSFNYVPFGFPLKEEKGLSPESFHALKGLPQELYKGVKEALNRRKYRDAQYRNKHHPKKEPALMISSEPKISVE
jgi:hypothetical protein